MQNLEGHVVSVRIDGSVLRAIIEVDSVVVCARCESGKGCGAGLLGRQSKDRRVEAIVMENLQVKNGDLVSLVLAPRNILHAAVIVYGYPLAGAVSAATIALGMGLDDGYGAIAALTGLGTGIAVAKLRLSKVQCLRDFTPTVVDKASLLAN
jgi:sigma-E factor negative regulatory protein RseC